MKINTLSTKFIIWFVGSLILTLAVMIAAFQIVFRISMDNFIRENIYTMQSELDLGVTEVVDESAYLFSRIVKSENAQLLAKTMDEGFDSEERTAAFETLVERAGIDGDYFNNVALILADVSFSLNGTPAYLDDDYSFLRETPNRIMLVGSTGDGIIVGIYSEYLVSDFTGTFLFCFKEERFSEMCSDTGDAGYSFIMRSDGLVISHENKFFVGKIIVESSLFKPETAPFYQTVVLDGVKSIVVTTAADSLNVRYGFDSAFISVLDYNYYFGKSELMLWIVFGVSVILFAIAVIFAVVRAGHITNPVKALSTSINAMQATEKRSSVLKEGDELIQLERNYDEMLDRIFRLMEKNNQEMQLKRKLELDTLQMQINPHFLYNTLDAISWLAKIKKQPEIELLVMNLARFFRLSLHKGDQFITVAEEIELTKHYIEIDKFRFPDRITEHYEVDDSILDCVVMKLVLQPLVENCLKYAFPNGGGNIWIRAYASGDDIIFEVEDDGVGFEVRGDMFTVNPENDGGYGLANVNERIHLQYGEGYNLTITSEIGKGTKATARIKKSIN